MQIMQGMDVLAIDYLCDHVYDRRSSLCTKDLYQVQETWKFFFLTHIPLCVISPILSQNEIQNEFKKIYIMQLFSAEATMFFKKINKCP